MTKDSQISSNGPENREMRSVLLNFNEYGIKQLTPTITKPESPRRSTETEGIKQPVSRLFSSENPDNTPDFLAEFREN